MCCTVTKVATWTLPQTPQLGAWALWGEEGEDSWKGRGQGGIGMEATSDWSISVEATIIARDFIFTSKCTRRF